MNPATAIGSRIGPYEIVGWLGAGGMGEVYRARDSRLGRDVAIKLVDAALASDGGRVRRFEQEARAAGQLNHPNILIVYDTGVHDGIPYLVSELLEGQTLRARLAAAALSPLKAIDAARQVAEGLAAAHDKGIVHRDVKPDNLFVTTDGRIKILDFGIAKLTTPPDTGAPTGLPTDTAAGTVVGTARYMSPEQIRGEPVDARSDIFSLGIVLYEMLTGRPAFVRDTAPETMAAILKEEPAHPLPTDVPPALARIVARCLEKSRETRFQSARDLAFGLDVLSGTHATAPAAGVRAARRWPAALGVTLVVLSLGGVVASWLNRTTPTSSLERLLTNATFTPFTNFEGSEQDAAISPDGKFVVFLSDRDGPFQAFLKQVSTGSLVALTPGALDYKNPGPVRSVGFAADGSEIWLSGTNGRRLSLVPLIGGAPRAFLHEHALNASWSPDGTRLVYVTYAPGDPLSVADRNGGNPNQIFVAPGGRSDHNHFPVWSTDGKWIYFTRSRQSLTEFDVFRIPPSGGEPDRLTDLNSDIRYLTPIDARTVLFVAPDQDQSGPWLWALDVEQKIARRVSAGLDRYLSVSARADGRRLVAAVAKSTAGLWSVPILDRIADERDVTAYPVPTVRGLAPRFGRTALFYLSSGSAADGLWRLQDGKASEIWKGSDGALFVPAAVSPREDRLVVVVTKQGKRRLTLMSADGADPRSLADTIDVRGTPSWSPDGEWVVTGGINAEGAGLFKIAVKAGTTPFRLAAGPSSDPVVSPDGTIIVYTGQQAGSAPLLAVRPDGSPVTLPPTRVLSGGAGRSRFLPNGNVLYMQGALGVLSFWLLDLSTNTSRQLTRLSNPAGTTTFDVTPDGLHIVFDRVREHSDLVLIDLVK